MKNRLDFFSHNREFKRCKTTIKFLKDGELYIRDGKIEDVNDFNLSKELHPFIQQICPPSAIIYKKVNPEEPLYAFIVSKEYGIRAFYAVLTTLAKQGDLSIVKGLLETVKLIEPEIKKELELPPQAAQPIPVPSIAPPPAPPRVNEEVSSEHDLRYARSPAFTILDEDIAHIYPSSPGSQNLLQDEEGSQSKRQRI